MFRFSIITVFCIAFCFPAFALVDKESGLPLECLHKDMSTQTMVECYKIQIDNWQKKIDDNLNKIYQSKKISERYKNQTREAQEKWLEYARLYSSSVCPSVQPEDCGTLSRITASQRLIDKLQERHKEVQKQLKDVQPLLNTKNKKKP